MKYILFLGITSFLFSSCEEEIQILCNPDFEQTKYNNDIVSLKNYQEALFCAQAYKMPIFIWFTGHGCSNYRKRPFIDKHLRVRSIRKLIKENFILLSLYVDEDKKLENSDSAYIDQWREERGISLDKKIRNIGNLNAQLQIGLIKKNSQPYYLVIDHNENPIADGFGFTKDSRLFKTKLEEVIQILKKNNKN